MRLRHFERDLTEVVMPKLRQDLGLKNDMQVTEGFTNKLQTIG